MSKKIKIPKATKGQGYSGVWSDGKIGWATCPYIYEGKGNGTLDVKANPHMKGERFFLCEIIIKPVLNKNGRPITKIIK